MERLKRVLKYAVTSKATRVEMAAERVPIVLANSSDVAVPSENAVEASAFKIYFAALFPQDNLDGSGDRVVRGAMNLMGVGKIPLLAKEGNLPVLRLYFPPDGETLREMDFAAMTTPLEIPLAIPVLAPPVPPPPPPLSLRPTVPPSPPATSPMSQLPTGAASVPANLFARSWESAPDSESKTSNPLAADVPIVPASVLSPVGLGITQPSPPVARVGEETAQVSIQFGRLPSEQIGQGPAGCPIDALLVELARRKSGDLHLTVGEPPSIRIDGEIERMDVPVLTVAMAEQYLVPIMPQLNQQEFFESNDTDFAYQAPDGNRFRVNVYRDRNGVACAMRLIPSTIPTAEQLGLPKVLLNLATLPKGLVLVTGPTGSGKSTTLAAMIDFVNKTRKVHLLTVEDPVEFVYKPDKALIHQREVRLHTGSFSRALRAALRENPDVVLIGEMRDLETTKIAIEVAETGHLVFGTLHTNTAIGTVDRIVDQFPADQQEQVRMMLASSLKGVVSQALIRRKGGGRVAALEVLIVNEAVQAMIREKKSHMIGNHMQSQKAEGNQLLNEAILNLVLKDVITPVDAFAKAAHRKELLEMFKNKGVDVSEIETSMADPNPKKK